MFVNLTINQVEIIKIFYVRIIGNITSIVDSINVKGWVFMTKYLKILLQILVVSVVLFGCAIGKGNDNSPSLSSLIEVKADDLIYKTSISPNKEFVKEEDIVNYNIEIYQNKDYSIIINASSNSAFFKDTQYIIDYNKKISKENINIKWTTLMGNVKYTQEDMLAIAHISLMENNEVFSERRINFVNGAIETVVDVIEKNK